MSKPVIAMFNKEELKYLLFVVRGDIETMTEYPKEHRRELKIAWKLENDLQNLLVEAV